MNSEVIKRENYTINFIYSDRFKNCQIEVLFKQKLDKNIITSNSLLSDFLQYSTYNLPTRRDLIRKQEYLYDSYISARLTKTGENLFHVFDLYFLNPKYCDEDYLEDVVKLLADIIFNPNFGNDILTEKAFKVCKQNYIDYLSSLKENPASYSVKQALKIFGEDSSTSVLMDGSLEELKKITVKDIKKTYNEFLNDTECYIYIVGNLPKDEVISYIDKYFKNIKKNENTNSISVYNKERDDVLDLVEEGPYKQDSLIVFYNLDLDTRKERVIDSRVFNYILGSGGLTSKLYDKLREKNSLCYTVVSYYNSYENYLYIPAGINKKDKELCLKLIDECLEEMVNGEFTEEDIKDCIKSFKNSYKRIEDTPDRIISYRFSIDFGENYELDERIKLLDSVSKDDVIKVAKKAKKNLTFLLCGDGENEEN